MLNKSLGLGEGCIVAGGGKNGGGLANGSHRPAPFPRSALLLYGLYGFLRSCAR